MTTLFVVGSISVSIIIATIRGRRKIRKANKEMVELRKVMAENNIWMI